MTLNNSMHNQGSIFEPIVSVEAWRTACDPELIGSVHVDVTFREAFLGAEPESQVRFQVSLRKAILKIIVSKRDPIVVVRASVDRGQIVETELTTSEKKTAAAGGEANLKLSTKIAQTGASVSGKLRAEAEVTETTNSRQSVRDKAIEQFVEDDAYCWEITPRSDQILKGKVWDALNEPRLKTRLNSAKARSEDCEVRLIIECHRQDIEITKIELKSKSLSLPMFRGASNNKVAAESALRDMIADNGFIVPNFSEPFSRVMITNIVIPEE